MKSVFRKAASVTVSISMLLNGPAALALVTEDQPVALTPGEPDAGGHNPNLPVSQSLPVPHSTDVFVHAVIPTGQTPIVGAGELKDTPYVGPRLESNQLPARGIMRQLDSDMDVIVNNAVSHGKLEILQKSYARVEEKHEKYVAAIKKIQGPDC